MARPHLFTPPIQAGLPRARGYRAVSGAPGPRRVSRSGQKARLEAGREGKWRMQARGQRRVDVMEDPMELVCSIVHASYQQAWGELVERPSLSSTLVNLRQLVAGILYSYCHGISGDRLIRALRGYKARLNFRSLPQMSMLERRTVQEVVWVVYGAATVLETTGCPLLLEEEERVEHVKERMRKGEFAAKIAVVGWLEDVYRRAENPQREGWLKEYWVDVITCLVVELQNILMTD